MPSDALSLAFATSFGLIIGSYVNVVVYRVPRGVSTAWPGSRCPRCVMPIRPWDNVPVLGWLWLGAKCRDCGLSIPPRYPLVEAAVGGWFAFCHLRSDGNFESVVASLLGALLLALALIDADHHLVPVRITALWTLAGVAVQPWLGWAAPAGEAGTTMSAPVSAWMSAALAAALGGLGMAALSTLGGLLGQGEGFGLGDAYAAAMIGAFLGWRGVLAAFLLAAGLALVASLVRRALSWRPGARSKDSHSGRRFFAEPIPFVTFLSMGTALVLIAGPLADGP